MEPLDTDLTWVEEYRGLSLDAVLKRAEMEGRQVRVVRPGQPMTMDLRYQRLNVFVDETGALVRVTAG